MLPKTDFVIDHHGIYNSKDRYAYIFSENDYGKETAFLYRFDTQNLKMRKIYEMNMEE